MKYMRIFVMLTVLLAALLLLAGCGGEAVGDAPVQGITDGGASPSEEEVAMLQEVFGLSAEEIAAMPAEELEAMLYELGYVMGGDGAENNTAQNGNGSSNKNKVTMSDVSAGGSWVVTIGDSLWWNYIELHYENGVLVRIVTHFQKSSEEEPEIEVLEGDAARAYSFYWIDFSADPATVAAELADKVGYTSVAIERAQ